MSKKDQSSLVLGPKAMEMVMRDVLGGMEELALMEGYESSNNVFEILKITTPTMEKNNCVNESTLQINSAKIIPFNPMKKVINR